MSELAEAYKHSGRWSPLGVVLPLLILGALAVPSGFIYSLLVFYIPIIYLNALATLFLGFAIGFLAARLLKIFKVRNLTIAIAVAVIAGLMCLYMSWVGHICAIYEDSPVIFMPQDLWLEIAHLYETGTWSLKDGDAVSGIMLGLVWVIELGIFTISPALTVYADISATPFCEKNNVWLNKEETIDSLALFNEEDIALLGTGDLAPLLHAQPKRLHDVAWTRLVLKSSEQSEDTYTMRMTAVHLKPDKDGNLEEATIEITNDLLIDKNAYAVVRKFADLELRAEEPVAEVVPEAAAEQAGEDAATDEDELK